MEDIFSIVATVLVAIIIASLIGVLIRRLRLKTWHLGLMIAIGFALIMVAGSEGATAMQITVQITGIVLLVLGSGGFFYMQFLGGAQRQQAERQKRHKERDDAANVSNGEPSTESQQQSQSTPKEQKKLF